MASNRNHELELDITAALGRKPKINKEGDALWAAGKNTLVALEDFHNIKVKSHHIIINGIPSAFKENSPMAAEFLQTIIKLYEAGFETITVELPIKQEKK